MRRRGYYTPYRRLQELEWTSEHPKYVGSPFNDTDGCMERLRRAGSWSVYFPLVDLMAYCVRHLG